MRLRTIQLLKCNKRLLLFFSWEFLSIYFSCIFCTFLNVLLYVQVCSLFFLLFEISSNQRIKKLIAVITLLDGKLDETKLSSNIFNSTIFRKYIVRGTHHFSSLLYCLSPLYFFLLQANNFAKVKHKSSRPTESNR